MEVHLFPEENNFFPKATLLVSTDWKTTLWFCSLHVESLFTPFVNTTILHEPVRGSVPWPMWSLLSEISKPMIWTFLLVLIAHGLRFWYVLVMPSGLSPGLCVVFSVSSSIMIWHYCCVLQYSRPSPLCGYEIWLVQVEMCDKCNITNTHWISKQRYIKYLINNIEVFKWYCFWYNMLDKIYY